jgi:L-Ala-D/L-Glu epimerase
MLETRRTVHVPWRTPLTAAHPDAPRDRELTVVTLEDDDGLRGHGESAPLAGYSGSDRESAEHAAVDMAEWDLRGRRLGAPVWRLLGADESPVVAVNATIGAELPSQAANEASAAARSGFRTIKVKVGTGDDLARVAAVRAAVGPEVGIRLDANGAWTVREAVQALGALAPFGLELCEEPTHGAEAIAAVAARLPALPIAADESASEVLGGARRVCTAVCLKLARGGITALLRDAERARSLGYRVYIASTLDGPLGIAAALHAAAAVAPDAACGLATLDRFLTTPPFEPLRGKMSPPPGPGLGDGLLEWYER